MLKFAYNVGFLDWYIIVILSFTATSWF